MKYETLKYLAFLATSLSYLIFKYLILVLLLNNLISNVIGIIFNAEITTCHSL